MRLLLTIAVCTLAGSAIGAFAADYADGLAGGPDFWAVTNVPPNDTLNVRAGPGTEQPVIGQLSNGDVVGNRGCQKRRSSLWCKINVGGEQKFTGWVNSKFLRETAPPRSGPRPCSRQWQLAVDRKLQTGDGDGHGPDVGSMEWRSVVEFKLGVRGNPDVPSRATVEWCRYIDRLMR